MAVINTYEDRVAAQGGLNTRADGAAFGANVGAAVQGLGGEVMNYGQTLYQNEVQNDVTNVHVEMAKKRAKWQQKLTDMANQTQPGDETFVPRLQQGLQSDFQNLSQSFKTREGQQTFAKMSADMSSMFMQEAVGIQSRLSGEFAKNQYNSMSNSLGSVAAQDHTQWESLVNQGKAAIDDPNGRFAKVPEATREAFKQSLEEQLKYDAAKGFARRYPNAVLGSVPSELRQSVQQAAANQPRPGLPPDLKAPVVKPYDQATIDSRAKLVNQPSQYDRLFQEAAQLYNLDWRELKMRAVVESGLNPNAKSSQGATGIMQMVPATAQQLGVDPSDPKAAIFAGAKLIADYRTKANGDMAKVDMMYYGGENGSGWGANTKQYAANLAALRQSVGLGSSVPPEAFAENAVMQVAASQDWKKPSTGIGFIDSLPADKFFTILTEAEHYQRAYDTQSERARIEREHEEKKAQQATMNGFLSRVIDPQANGALDEQEIIRNPTLTWEQKQHMIDYKIRRTRELAAMAESKSNPAEVRRLMLLVHAADDDPAKTYNMDPVMDAYKMGNISTPEMQMLRKEVEQLRDGNTNGFAKDVNNARNVVFTALTRSILGQAQPEVAADAAYRFNADMEKQIETYRKQNKDPRVLLDPTSRDYLLKPERIQSFMQNGRAAVSEAATKVVQQQAAAMPTYKDYDKLAKGAQFTDPQGNVRVKP